MKLIRKILEYTECKGNGGVLHVPELGEYTVDQVHSHVGLCQEAGYLVVEEMVDGSNRQRFVIDRLTWHGHNALDEMRKGGP